MSTEKTISGSWIVDEISKMHINSIPQAWYKTIRQKKAPHAMAILILWELLYWYKWTEIRDEQSDRVIGYKKKFKADLLQRSYGDIAEKFGITKRQATDILYFLRDEGIVTLDLRTVTANGIKISNVLFIGLNPKKIAEISDERNLIDTEESDSTNEKSTKLSAKEGNSYHEFSLEGSRKSDRQIQSITQSNSQTNTQFISQSTSSPQPSESFDKDSLPQEENSNSHSDLFSEQTEKTNSHSVSKADCKRKTKKRSEVSFKNSDYTLVYQAYLDNVDALIQQGKLKKKYEIPYFLKKDIKKFFTAYGVEKVLNAVKKSINDYWLVNNTDYSPTVIFNDKVMYNLIKDLSSDRTQTYSKPAASSRQFDENHLIF